MQRLKNKKRLTALVLAFLLVFSVGAAFAATPGVLDVRTQVRIVAQDLYVRWASAEANTTSPGIHVPFGVTLGDHVTQSAEISDTFVRDGDTRSRQRIEWEIHFGGAGNATLVAEAENIGPLAALIHDATYSWEFAMGPAAGNSATAAATALGLGVDIFDMMFAGVLAAGTPTSPATTAPVMITVAWGGNIPDGFATTHADAVYTPAGGGAQQIRLILVIEFDYTAAP